ncbi:unnamed protein product, partial [Adineta steineri]
SLMPVALLRKPWGIQADVPVAKSPNKNIYNE